jgi:eukaryotic-like serine/threonine-protein kinase
VRDARRAQLQRVCRAYLHQASALTYRDLCANQDAPWASIAFGAAGIAGAQWRSGRSVASARRWLAAAARASRARGAFWSPALGNQARPSLYYGADGLRFLRLLIASRDMCPASSTAAGWCGLIEGGDSRALRAFLARCRRCRGGPSELLQGVAGYLTALVILYRRVREPRVLRVADELAHDLLERAGGRRGWARAPRLAFAHGRAGTFHALLTWSLVGGRQLPAELFGELARLADDVARGGTMGASSPSSDPPSPARQRSWCNGAAGLVLMWARAYEHTHDVMYLRHARDAARFTLTHIDDAPGDLCCGLAGRAYALLAMDRIAPGRDWSEHACAMASRAATVMLEACGPWPNGLYKGYPGLVCLTRDLSEKPAERVGFPLVEG